jgi:rfaE bifunctional protein nucleotidyltransferase chain/domain
MTYIDRIQEKQKTTQEVVSHVKALRSKNEKIAFTNGCFDILHRGHVDYLSKAAEHGKLIVGVNTDASVKQLDKGSNRPIQDEHSRAMLLAALECVEAVVLFDEATPFQLIKAIMPDVLIKGGDYAIQEIVGHDIVQENGGAVITIPLVAGFSTSNIEQKIRHSTK